MIPLATSSYTVERADMSGDSGDELSFVAVATGVRGTSVYYSGTESVMQGDRERVDGRIMLDTDFQVKYYDRLVDETTGDTWALSFVRKRLGFGLEHLVCGVYEITGSARGTRDN